MFLQKDLDQFRQLGIDVETIEQQLLNFKNGFPFVILTKPATVKDGIIILDKEHIDYYITIFELTAKNRKVIKFVPASGAASRMFKNLFTFREKYKPDEKGLHLYESDKSFNSVYRFITEIKKFPFYQDLKDVMLANNEDIEDCLQKKNYHTIINFLLDEKGLNYGSLPKGLLKFHHYQDFSRTAIEEHLVEGVHYAKDANSNVFIHFTISPEHIEKFTQLINEIKPKYESLFNVIFKISHSIQKPATDTIAVELNNEVYRESDGNILFRPGGHGALIENLNDLSSDIIFVKNIDNIVPDKYKELTYSYKKALGGYLISIQLKTFEYLKILETGVLDDGKLDEIIDFAQQKLQIRFHESFENLSREERIKYIFNRLNRPIRICGMVKNEGEPGGGPFWVRNLKGEISLQIIESSQINLENSGQNQVYKAATHFNPVDLVCGVRDYKGKLFDLKQFIDFSTGFISTKSKDGRNLKAQELPGLWNGAMAEWISVFVEVPIITFNPVKTINDLLRVEHQ
jgi:hypothetical protein